MAVARRFKADSGRPLQAAEVGRVVFGRFELSPRASEELVVGLVAADEVELHCHGGSAVVAAICEALVAEGCLLQTVDQWAEETERDLIASAARLALAQARTERTAAILLDQYRGALAAELRAIVQFLTDQQQAAAAAALRRLLDRAELGLHLTQPWEVVIAGAPNAGKSSLVNAILGYERAIVWQEPGTTRDVLAASTAIDSWPVELTDTAGLRLTEEPIEAEGVARAERQIAAADLVIFVAETTAPWSADLYGQVSSSRNSRPLLVVHNKCDLAPPSGDRRPAGVNVSAKTTAGIDALLAAVSRALVPLPPPGGAPVPFTREQIAAIKAAAAQLARGDARAACDALTALVEGNRSSRSAYNDRCEE